MIQEYLFTTEEYRAEVECFTVPTKIQKEITNIENSSCWIFCLSIDSESEEAAKLLDPLNTQICEKYKPTVLTNECSAYFNKSLFPIVNEFERKLRKFLYLTSALQGDEEAHKNISDLELKDLGTIFEILFTDESFITAVKSKINNKTWKFTRAEVLTSIQKIDENSLWDKLSIGDYVKTLRNQYIEIKNYRNDVMHAHNINADHYRNAKKLFQKVNEELDVAIGKLIGIKEENKSIAPADFNSTLSLAISLSSEMMNEIIAEQPTVNPKLAKNLSESREYMYKSELQAVISNADRISELKKAILPTKRELDEIAKYIVANKIEMPPVMTKLRQRVSEAGIEIIPKNKNYTDENEEDL